MMTVCTSWKTWAKGLTLSTLLYSGGLFAAPANPDIVARVGDSVITRTQLEQAMAETLREHWQQQLTAQNEALETLIRERLLELEAARQGVSVETLQTQMQAATISNAQVNAVLRQAEIDPKKAGPSEKALARSYLLAQQTQEQVMATTTRLAATFPVERQLPLPVLPAAARLYPQGADDLSRGQPNAPVTLVVFSDFACGYCRKMDTVINTVRETYRDRLRIVYRYYPLGELDGDGGQAAVAAQCAAEQSRFWDYHDALQTAADLKSGTLTAVAKTLGLNQQAFAACQAGKAATARVQADIDEGNRLGVSGTPASFINGIPVSGALDTAVLTRIIEAELAVIGSTTVSPSVSIPSVEIRVARPTLPATANMKMRIARLVKPIMISIGGFLLPLAFFRVV